MSTTVKVQVFATYTVHADGVVTADVDLGAPDLEFAVGQEDFGDAEYEALEAIERVTVKRAPCQTRVTLRADA